MYWAYASIDSELRQLSESLLHKISDPDNKYEVETNPHITLIPGFQTEHPINLPTTVIGEDIPVKGFRFFESEEFPLVVMLEFEETDTLTRLRNTLQYQIGESNIEYPIHPFHATLFKAGDAAHMDSIMLEDELCRDVVQTVTNSEPPEIVSITGVTIGDWES